MVYQNLKLGLLKNQIEINNIKIISLVDKILQLKGRDINSDTKEFEEEIDRVVYGLYGLTEWEIKIIENKN